ncbi:hypothetical protein [Comamonas sp. UBA7528]|uniref:hypothetical protein n=1 Tax=Comamonas sp. UBA7528 TaxID=1946391 RepID=UPI0025BEB7E2|nr:hypothetical protein [Comamonas sp. UBA7528]
MAELVPHPASSTKNAGIGQGVDASVRPTSIALSCDAVEAQNDLLASIEARLTEEMRGLALSLAEFGCRTKAIREEIPDSAQFCKLVAGCLPLFALQLSDAILRAPQGFTFEDDGALYLKQLGLELKDFVRELDLEGRKFLAVAFLDKSGRDVLDSPANGNEL